METAGSLCGQTRGAVKTVARSSIQRTGVAAYCILRVNGGRIQVHVPDAVEVMVTHASGDMEEEAFAVWLRQRAIYH